MEFPGATSGETINFKNCTIADNIFSSGQHLIDSSGNANINFTNTVIWGNQDSTFTPLVASTNLIDQALSNTSINSSLIQSLSSSDANEFDNGGTGNLDASAILADSLFIQQFDVRTIDPASITIELATAANQITVGADHTPQENSALIDAGNAGDTPPSKDILGYDRIYGSAIDVGAYERPSAYDAWAGSYYGPRSPFVGFDLDPYDTGVPNGLAFVSGVPPWSDQSAIGVTKSLSASGYTNAYRQHQDAAYLVPFFEYSTDMVNWHPATDSVNGISVTRTVNGYGGNVDKVEVTIDDSLFPECFLRQGITAP